MSNRERAKAKKMAANVMSYEKPLGKGAPKEMVNRKKKK